MKDAFAKAAALIRSWKRPLIISHTKPDGDAIGSVSAMRSFVRHGGGQPLAVLFDGIPPRYAFLNQDQSLHVLGKSIAVDDLHGIDGVVVVDTCAVGQVEPLAAWLKSKQLPTVVVDHHVTRDLPATHYVIDENAAATALIMYEWFANAELSMDVATAEALLVGIGTDTGWFRHSNTDARALGAAADLVRRGARLHDLAQMIYQRDSAARVRLLGEVLDTLELFEKDRLAVMSLSQAALQKVGARLSDSEDMVNEPLRIQTVVMSILCVEQEPSQGAPSDATKSRPVVRVNFRSKAPVEPGDVDIDVAQIAKQFGGGGHRRAAGARLAMGVAEAKRAVVDACTRTLRGT